MSPSSSLVSERADALSATEPGRRLFAYLDAIDYDRRAVEPNALDFTFGNPHDMPAAAYVAALQHALIPQHPGWFGYQSYQPAAQGSAAASLRRLTGLPFAPDDILLTTGGFSALALGLKLVADPGDEVIFNLPPWFFYEGLALDAGLIPVKVGIDPGTLDLDLDAIAAAITPRTRIFIINTPNNPTGRIYPPTTLRRLAALLDAASARNGRRIMLLSDEAYNRIVFSDQQFHPPAAYYPYTLVAYSYGKTLLAPGQRIGYLALPPNLPEREALRPAARQVQMMMGCAYPNADLQYALPDLEGQVIDLAQVERRRDLLVGQLTQMGYQVRRPEGTFYLFPRSPDPDDVGFAQRLADAGILVVPGTVFETAGFFRICLTASDAMCERALPGFAAAIRDTPAVAV
ncbi:MAG TPA: aminotransferase class I/II-fold pyridoxal phosphate-dependent enzyme, partial [Thermomicrobiales bacterium]|nr:aminotransferase class I/II-fold pyridoxal phosphate-dependent enzyme [Thermomicrobiales bacterium]